MNTLALSLAAAALVLASVACAAPSGAEPSSEAATSDGPTGQTEERLGSNGFICNGNGCVCDPDSDSPVDSCDGMATFCDRIGHGMLCAPGGWCFCRVARASVDAQLPATPPAKPSPTRAAQSANATATKIAP